MTTGRAAADLDPDRIAAGVARRYAWLADKIPAVGLDDLRQEASIALWRWEVEHPEDPAGPTLLFELARRAVVAALRRARPRGRPSAAVVPLGDLQRAARPADPDAPLDLRDALRPLTPALRVAVERRRDGWSQAESAAADGISTKTDETRIRRAFIRLRPTLAAYAPRAATASC